MRLIILATVAFMGVLGAAGAQDKPASKAELQKLVVGKSVGIGSSSAFYGADGRYTFNGSNPGKYRIDNGRICVDFDAGQARCDKIVKDAGSYYLINGQGGRFQFKP